MNVHFRILLILTGLAGHEVPVTAGKSITIPCLYESKYINHVKYLCKGSTWRSCTYAVRTDKPDPSGKFSISDDKTLKIFTVTIQNLNKEDSYYWCNVEINHGPDDGIRFQLSVTEGKNLSKHRKAQFKSFINFIKLE
uniref:Immunoglobulin domain-containing protein n=1 Tax=Echeneis naucrates TaxID=173247 RepID=A0A665X2X7_ECHNA